MSGPQILGLITAFGMLALLVELLRRRRLREKYALLWSVMALIALVVAIFPSLLDHVTHAIGLQVPANLIFFASLLVLFGLSIQFSFEIGRLEERVRTLAEEIALLRAALREHHPDHDRDE